MRKIDRKNNRKINRKINCETSREINHEINYEVNRETLTYRELKAMVPATPKGKMPRADKLTGEILFTEEVDGAIIRIYKNGFLTYAVNNGDEEPRTTVYSVHKCSKIVFFTGFSEDEYKEECGWCGEHSKVSYRVVENPVTGNRQLTRIVTVDEKAYQNCVWWLPIVTICDERLGHNDYARFMNKIDLKDNDDFDMDEHDPNDWLEAITLSEEDEENHEILVEAMKTLTKVQYKTVALYYHEGLSERDIAKVLKVKHQSVHDNLEAAMQRLRKFFFENLTSE